MKLKIAILAGDGIGPEIMKQGVAVLDAIAKKCGHQFEYEEAICGAHAIDEVGDPYPDSTMPSTRWATLIPTAPTRCVCGLMRCSLLPSAT